MAVVPVASSYLNDVDEVDETVETRGPFVY